LAEPGTSDPFSPDATWLLNAMANAPTDPGSVENTVDGFKSRLGNDYLSENDGDDKINGGWGNDTIYGGGGDDTIYASTSGGGISGVRVTTFSTAVKTMTLSKVVRDRTR
jgi:Ca2+-binding RTX toxin-like protein